MSVRKRIEELERRVNADPRDLEARLELVVARGRLEGPDVYLELLNDRLNWNRASNELQDVAINEAARRLESSFEYLKTEVYKCQNEHRIAAFCHRKSGAVFHLLPAGRFFMGSTEENVIDDDEFPRHEVHIRRPFLISRGLISQAEFERWTGTNPSHFIGDDLPVENVSWNDIQNWLKKSDDGSRLLSEAEWEYACRAGTSTMFYWGDDFDTSYVWCSENSTKTHPVTSLAGKCNSFGLIDMIGHLDEWCQDVWIEDYENGPYDERPRSTEGAYDYCARGSHWSDSEGVFSSAYRYLCGPDCQSETVGLRLARSLY